MPRSLAYDPRHALNAICPYFTMFPLEYPIKALRKHINAAPVVMDPFCGRGTSLYAARVLGLRARGLDSSPIAIAIAQAKLCRIDKSAVLKLAHSFIDADKPDRIPQSDFFRRAFHSTTLRQICAVRAGLLRQQSQSYSAVLLRAAMLGCLHGPRTTRLETQPYFSNQMPRTFASKPEYSLRYWRAHKLFPPRVNVISVLERKLARIVDYPGVRGVSAVHARLGDSRSAAALSPAMRDFSVVVTSPPYYGMRTYVEDQWLRYWFLGGPAEIRYGESDQISHTGQQVFAESLGEVWRNMARTRSDRLDMYIRFGIIPSARVDARRVIEESLEASEVDWRIVYTRPARTAGHGRRQAQQMSAASTPAIEYDFHVVAA
jgi:hypothetical protein